MGQSRTLGAVRSYFSKNRKRLDYERIANETQAQVSGVDVNVVSAQQVVHLTSPWLCSAYFATFQLVWLAMTS